MKRTGEGIPSPVLFIKEFYLQALSNAGRSLKAAMVR